MKTRITILVLVLGFLTQATSQQTSIYFTATDTTGHVQLDSTLVKNLTTGEDTTLYWPDTLLTIENNVGLPEVNDHTTALLLFQNYPNPVIEQTTITFHVPENDKVHILITDLLGRQIISTKKVFKRGNHIFNFKPCRAEVCFFTAIYQGSSYSIKIINSGQSNQEHCLFNYIGYDENQSHFKNAKSIQNFSFTEGDVLLYVGYSEDLQSGKQGSPIGTDTSRLYFGAGVPCPGMPTVNYGGKSYNTVQVYSQCWLKENLNIGNMLFVPNMPTNNDTIEKYCLADQENYCDILGGLYYWEEMMNYTNQNGAQGICPEGWHIPDDLDWQILEGAVDNQYRIGDNIWSTSNWRGNDAGGNLKQTGTTLWEPPNSGATDLYGFNAIPGGYFVQGAFWGPGHKGYFWSSDNAHKYYRNMDWNQTGVKRDVGVTGIAFSVRCVKNN